MADTCNYCGHSDGNHAVGTGKQTRFGEGPCLCIGCPCRHFTSEAYP